MKKYEILTRVTTYYAMTVEADSLEQAQELACYEYCVKDEYKVGDGEFIVDDINMVSILSNKFVIVNENDETLLWSNTDGWVDDECFDTFTLEESEELYLPVEGKWIRLSSVKGYS